ncbi:MAG: DUF5130 family protein [Actinomycetota bacterium]|nr:DUF5130 family protein [Actinomycetota bacterium]
MPTGEVVAGYGFPADASSPLSDGQRRELSRIVQRARMISGYCFGVFVGPLPEGRVSAVAHHRSLPDPRSAVLVAVDPAARAIEIVLGSTVAIDLSTRSCELAALSMKSAFAADDLVNGLRDGVTLLAEHARHPKVLHLDDTA